MQTKQCSRCERTLPLESFHRNKSWRDSRCPGCKSEIAREHREQNQERLVAQTQKYQEQNREYFREYNRRYRKKKKDARLQATADIS